MFGLIVNLYLVILFSYFFVIGLLVGFLEYNRGYLCRGKVNFFIYFENLNIILGLL